MKKLLLVLTLSIFPTVANAAGALVHKTVNQAIPSQGWHAVTYDSVDYDALGIFDADTSRFVITQAVIDAGFTRARLCGQVWYGGQAPSPRGMRIARSQPGVAPTDRVAGLPNVDFSDTGSATASMATCSAVIKIEVGDAFEFQTCNLYKSAKNLWGTVSNGNNWFSIELLP